MGFFGKVIKKGFGASMGIGMAKGKSSRSSNVPSTISSSDTAVPTIGKSKGSLGMAHAMMAAKRTRPTTTMKSRPTGKIGTALPTAPTGGGGGAVGGGRKKPRKSSLATSTY